MRLLRTLYYYYYYYYYQYYYYYYYYYYYMQRYGEMRIEILIALNEQSKRNSLFRNVQEVI